jgi:hypothetical protein
MKPRNRIPTIFSIYMVDVLCCALGCVILLWQVNYFEAEEQTAAARIYLQERELARENLRKVHLSVDSLSNEVNALQDDLQAAKKREVQVTLELNDARQERDRIHKLALVYKTDYDNAKKAQAQLESLLDNLRLDYKELAKKTETTATSLAEKARLTLDLARKMKEATLKIVNLEKELDEKKTEALLAAKKIAEQTALLQTAEARGKKLASDLADVRALGKDFQNRFTVVDLRSKLLEQDLDRSRKDLLDTSKRFQEMVLAQEILSKRLSLSSKEMDEARAIVAALQNKNRSLAEEARTVRLAAENRFAGITLTGNRVIFLVDMSGSMELVEETVIEPDKWPLVCETVGKLMKSLPDLRQYQVILFSDKARYPLGNDGRWLEYLPQSSASATVDTIKAVKPKGETNMYVAFDEAFRFRDQGLDTIYVLSDGLPTGGEGLPANFKTLTESQKTELLGKHLRSKLKNEWNRNLASQPRVRINTIGFFYESPDVGAFLWALAREHNGSFVGMSRP